MIIRHEQLCIHPSLFGFNKVDTLKTISPCLFTNENKFNHGILLLLLLNGLVSVGKLLKLGTKLGVIDILCPLVIV